MTRGGRASRIVIAAAPFVFMALACAANVAPMPMYFLLSGGFVAFFFGLLTLIIEGAAAYAFGYRTRRELGNVLLCSLITHPTLYLAIIGLHAMFGNAFLRRRWNICIAALEIIVIIAEYRILTRRLPERRAMNAKLAVSIEPDFVHRRLVDIGGLILK